MCKYCRAASKKRKEKSLRLMKKSNNRKLYGRYGLKGFAIAQ